ncbi:MAG: thiamine pyrophosphate-binding protein [Acidobacteriota bacterium]|nr:thiamine pyrophosphate-binding protein [Acidobacteriota bacterium]
MSYRGRQVFMETLTKHGIRYMFGNPGTTEMPIMNSLIDYPEIEYILALHESVAVGIGHYYAQASGIPAVVNVHVGPGLGNSLGMLYNAYEANTPMLMTAGQQDTRMRLREPLLGHDLVAMAEPLVKWSVEVKTADEMAPILHRALKIATEPPEGPVFVALPINVLEEETEIGPIAPSGLYLRSAPDPRGIVAAAELIAEANRPAVIVGDAVGRANAVPELVAFAETLGAPVYAEGLCHLVNFPTDHPCWGARASLEHGGIRNILDDSDLVILLGGSFFEEVWFDDVSPFPDGAKIIQMEPSPHRLSRNFVVDVGVLGDLAASLDALTAAVRSATDGTFAAAAGARFEEREAAKAEENAAQQSRTEEHWSARPISAARLMAEIRDCAPDDLVIVNEAITAGGDVARTLHFEPGDQYGTRGGGIGQAVPGVIGAKLAHPDRPVLALSGDGSALYSIQALWSAAYHDLPLVWVILHNRTYRILKYNMDIYLRRFGLPGDRPYSHMDLTKPDIDFVDLAKGFGVAGETVREPEEIRPALERAFAAGKPYLLDVFIEGAV